MDATKPAENTQCYLTVIFAVSTYFIQHPVSEDQTVGMLVCYSSFTLKESKWVLMTAGVKKKQ